MQRNLYLVRHAKSSWDQPMQPDYERTLNERGMRDAPFMSRFCRAHELSPDLLVSSGALRAYKTAVFFAQAFEMPVDRLLREDRLYEAGPRQILKVVQEIPDSCETVYLFGHNPGFTQFVNWCKAGIDNMPTCSIVRIGYTGQHWADFVPEETEPQRFHFPKQFFQ